MAVAALAVWLGFPHTWQRVEQFAVAVLLPRSVSMASPSRFSVHDCSGGLGSSLIPAVSAGSGLLVLRFFFDSRAAAGRAGRGCFFSRLTAPSWPWAQLPHH